MGAIAQHDVEEIDLAAWLARQGDRDLQAVPMPAGEFASSFLAGGIPGFVLLLRFVAVGADGGALGRGPGLKAPDTALSDAGGNIGLAGVDLGSEGERDSSCGFDTFGEQEPGRGVRIAP